MINMMKNCRIITGLLRAKSQGLPKISVGKRQLSGLKKQQMALVAI